MQMEFVEVSMEEGTSSDSTNLHQVVPPPYKSSLEKFITKIKEILFPDDPLRQFKGQPLHRKLILGAQYVFPLLQWAPTYSFKLFKSDLISGLTIASLAIPQVTHPHDLFSSTCIKFSFFHTQDKLLMHCHPGNQLC